MHQADYRLIANSDLRNVIRSVVVDPRDLPTRSQLRAQLVEACPPGTDAKVIDALVVKCAEFAKAAADPGARWDLRASCDALTLHVLKSHEASERLVQADDDEDTAPVDVSNVMASIDSYDPTQGALRAVESAAKASALGANLTRQAGGQ